VEEAAAEEGVEEADEEELESEPSIVTSRGERAVW